jgi:hypothetical protein
MHVHRQGLDLLPRDLTATDPPAPSASMAALSEAYHR